MSASYGVYYACAHIYYYWFIDKQIKKAGSSWYPSVQRIRLPAVGSLKRYSKALEYEYRVKTAALGTLKRYYILSLTLYLEWYSAYSIL
jgi:hypothetical protein